MKIKLSDSFSYKRLLRFTFPSIIMMLFTSIYGVVDGLFISNFVGSVPFAAVNLIIPFTMVFGAFGFMIGQGGTALVSVRLGCGEEKRANRIFSLLIYTLCVVGMIFSLIGFAFMEQAAKLLGASDEMLPHCITYGRILMLAIVPFMLQYVFQSFFVTAERPDLGLFVTIAAGVSNMVFDYLFMAVLRFGVAGAACATAISQCIGGILPLIFFSLPNKSKLRLGKTIFSGRIIAMTCVNGSSELMSNLSMSVVNMLYNLQLMKLAGSDGVSAYGVIMYVNFIFLSIFFGYNIGAAPVIGYHYGAANKNELKSLLRKSLVITAFFSVALTLSSELFAYPLSWIFTNYDKDLLAMTARGFRIFSLSFLISGVNIFASSFFTALNNGLVSAAISFARTLVFQIFSVLLLPLLFGLDGIWAAIVLAEFLSILLSVYFFVSNREKYGYF